MDAGSQPVLEELSFGLGNFGQDAHGLCRTGQMVAQGTPQRVLRKIPACVEACKTDALVFGEINELVKLARTKLEQSVSVAAIEMEPESVRGPDHVVAWRSLGKAVSTVGVEE